MCVCVCVCVCAHARARIHAAGARQRRDRPGGGPARPEEASRWGRGRAERRGAKDAGGTMKTRTREAIETQFENVFVLIHRPNRAERRGAKDAGDSVCSSVIQKGRAGGARGVVGE